MDGNYLSRNNYKHSRLNKNSILTFKTNFLYSPYSYSKEEIDRDFNQRRFNRNQQRPPIRVFFNFIIIPL